MSKMLPKVRTMKRSKKRKSRRRARKKRIRRKESNCSESTEECLLPNY